MKNAVAIVSLITIFTLFFTFGMGCTDPDVEERISFLGCSAGVVKDNRTDNRDYVFKVVSVVDNDKILSVEELRFTLFSADRRDMSDGHHRVSDIYENPINDKNFFSFRDGDSDGKLSVGDRFIIKSYDHVDDDGSADSPGYAEPGYYFELRAGKTLLFEVVI